jgi:hypothetical protein
MSETFEFRTDDLRASLSEGEDEPHEVHGVILGEDERTTGQHSEKFWPADEQKKAAETLVGEPFAVMHEDNAIDVGEVVEAGYKEGLGTFYEAEVEHKEVAAALSTGAVETSLEASVPDHDHIERLEDGTPFMTDYEYDRIVALPGGKTGASEANYTAPGSVEDNPALSAALAEATAEISLEVGEMPIDMETLVSLGEECDIEPIAFAEAAGKLYEERNEDVNVVVEHNPDPERIVVN